MKKNKFGTKTLVIAALMTALSFLIGFVCKTYLTFGAIRITFENLPIIISGIAFGPFVGGAVGAASDIVSCLASGYSINPMITVGAAVVGAAAGVVARHLFKKRGYVSLLGITLISHALGSMLIKSAGLYLSGYAIEMVLLRIPLYTGITVAESYIIYILYKNRRIYESLGGREV